MVTNTSLAKKGIRSDVLKMIAMICMLVDHIGAGILAEYLKVCSDYDVFMRVHTIHQYMQAIGRFAFPIFAYQLIVGFYKTSNRKKMCLRLFLFCLISEIPFDHLFNDSILEFTYQNVFFTLLFGFISVWAIDTFKETKYKYLGIIVSIAMIYVAYLIHSDYSGAGVVLIIAMYTFYPNKDLLSTAVPVIFYIVYFLSLLFYHKRPFDSAVRILETEMYSLIGFILIYFDNGKRLKNGFIKWLGYLYYPLHLIIIYLVRLLVLK